MPGSVGDGQKGQEVAGEPDDGVDDAPDSGNLSQRRMDRRTATVQGFTFFCQTVRAQVVHLLQATGRRIVGCHSVECHLLRYNVKAELKQHDYKMIVQKISFPSSLKTTTVHDQNKSGRNN